MSDWIVREVDAATLTLELSGFSPGPWTAFDDPAPRHFLACAAAAPQRPLAQLSLERGIGLRVPRAWYRLGWAVHAADELRLFRRQRTLLLGNDLTGSDALGGFAMAPELSDSDAQSLWQALISGALTAQSQDAAASCIAELPGLRDAAGVSPFWQGLGQHFHHRDLTAARQAHGAAFDSHVAALLPRHLLYAAFLPDAAQAAMGGCNSNALPLQRALQAAGFRWREHITATDAGPVMQRD